MQQATLFQERVVLLTRSMIRESRDYLKKNSVVRKCCVCVAKPIVATIEKVTSKKITSKGLKERTLEHCGDVPMTKYLEVLEEAVNVTSTNR